MPRAHASTGLVLAIVLTSPALASAGSQTTPEDLTGALQQISGVRMHQMVGELSAPAFRGRQSGTDQDLQSARYVAEQFRTLSLREGGDTDLPSTTSPNRFAMTVPVPVTWISDRPRLVVSTDRDTLRAQHGTDFLSMLDSPAVKVTAPLVFVGYGISDPARGLDEYAGIDVRNRIVMFLRGKPDRYPMPVSQAEKERLARERGAVAYLTVTGPVIGDYEARRGLTGKPNGAYSRTNGDLPLPGGWISTELGEKILAAQGRSLRDSQDLLNRDLRPQSYAMTAQATLVWESTHETGILYNVLGLMPGRDGPGENTIVIGAHRDHLGSQGPLLFPGADDNASGTAVILEVARVLAGLGITPKRSLLFISFSGEEQGLIGSRLYVSRPTRPLDKTTAMINIDHAGVGNGRLTVGVTGLEKERARAAGEAARLADHLDLFGFFPGGDHVPFKEAGVPTVTVVTSGRHPDFHQPTDTTDKVQPALLESVARYVLALVWSLAYE
ncbi:MAG: M28 family peptidase [Nitrospirae bacterium]|nr:M28 family peptidase [Nitrospirota bacterium]